MSGTDAFAHDDAAYVLGALGPTERRAFEEHLAGCDACARSVRDLAGMPGLLARLDESAFAETDDLPPVPETLLPQLLRTVRRQRRRARLLAVAGIAAAAALAVVVGLLVRGGSDPAPPEARQEPMTQVDQNRLEASVTLQKVAWGTKIHLSCTYDEWGEGSPPSYALVVHPRDGASQQVATWRAVPGRTTELEAATDVDRAKIAAVDVVVIGSGRKVLTLGPVH